jgi:hypothetical protein
MTHYKMFWQWSHPSLLHILIGILWEYLSADVLDEHRGSFFEVML